MTAVSMIAWAWIIFAFSESYMKTCDFWTIRIDIDQYSYRKMKRE